MGPYRHRDEAAVRRFSQFIVIAVLIHLAAIPLLRVLVPKAPQRTGTKAIKLVTLTPQMRQQLKRQSQPRMEDRSPPRPKAEEKVKPVEELDGQLVDIPASPDDTPPEEYDFLSEHNTRTERETVSRHRDKNTNNALNEVTRSDVAKAAAPQPEANAKAIEIGPAEPLAKAKQKLQGSEQVFELPTIKPRDRLALKLDPELGRLANQAHSEAMKGNSQRLKLALGEEKNTPEKRGRAPNQGDPSIDLLPSIGVMAQISGAPMADHVEGIEEGEGTFLNSREFKYGSYFNRMKRGVSKKWNPMAEYRRRDPTGNVYGQRPRVTVLNITLNADGELKEVEVQRSSGLDFLDNEAVAAFRRAEPFPNPPKGLVDSDTGLIEFPFGFHIEFSRSGLRLPF